MTKTDTKRRPASSCASAELVTGEWFARLLAKKAEPRINSRLTRIEPRMEAWTMRMWLLTRAILLELLLMVLQVTEARTYILE